MASDDELAALHRAADIPPDDTTYSDDILADYIDENMSVPAAAAVIWREKAAALAMMVDTTESGSSRKLSDLHANALAMAKGFSAVVVDDTVVSTRRSYTTQIERL
jgi:hypothetical protein